MTGQLHIFKDQPDDGPLQNIATPTTLYRELEIAFAGRTGFAIDVCAEEWSSKAQCYFDAEIDALRIDQSWGDTSKAKVCARLYAFERRPVWAFPFVWCNPPYGNIEPWLMKGLREVQAGAIRGVCYLIPHRTDREWWHRLVIPNAWHIEPIEGRVAFEYPPGAEKKSAPYEPSVAVVFRNRVSARRRDAARTVGTSGGSNQARDGHEPFALEADGAPAGPAVDGGDVPRSGVGEDAGGSRERSDPMGDG